MPSRQQQSDDSEVPSFYWWYEDTDKPVPLTLASCSQAQFGVGPNPNSTAPAKPPYTLIVYPSGFPARRYQAGRAGDVTWTVDLPEGTTAVLQFVDSQGQSGGTSPLTTITSGTSTSCISPADVQDETLEFSFRPQTPLTCQHVTVDVKGGEPPYTLTVVRAGITAINLTDFGSEAVWTNTLSAGAGAMYALSDSAGNYAPIPEPIFSQGGGNTTCQPSSQASSSEAQAESTQSSEQSSSSQSGSSSSSTSGAVIGGAVAAAVLALFVGIGVGFLFFQRRRKRTARASNRLSVPGLYMHQSPQGRHQSGASAPPRGFSPAPAGEEMQPPRFNFRVHNPDPDSDTSTVAPDDTDRFSISSSWGPGPSGTGDEDAHSITSMPSTISGARDMSTTGYAHSRHTSWADEATAQKRRSYSLHKSASASTISTQ